MMDYTGLPYVVEYMRLADIKEVMEIERVSFPTPWSARAYRHELTENDRSHYFVVRQRPAQESQPRLLNRVCRSLRGETKPPILGYGGFWVVAGEAHISTIAVHPNWRRRGIGELLLVAMLDRAIELGAEIATLEVRVSNIVAQNLYRKYGFEQVGLRRRYYSDRGEDALIMTTERLTSITFQSRFQRLKQALREKLNARAAKSAMQELGACAAKAWGA